jgi:hypothetical protein
VEGLRAAAASTNRAVESQNGHGCLGGSSMISSRGRPHFAQDTDVCNLVIRRFSPLPRISAAPERLYPPEGLYTVGRACLPPRIHSQFVRCSRPAGARASVWKRCARPPAFGLRGWAL